MDTGSPGRTGWKSREGVCPSCARAGPLNRAVYLYNEPAESLWVSIRELTNVSNDWCLPQTRSGKVFATGSVVRVILEGKSHQ